MLQQVDRNVQQIQETQCRPSIILVTWNMQGANWGDTGTNPWQFVMNWFKDNNIDICCLQECGRLPASVTQNDANLVAGNINNINGLNLYRWRIGTSTRGMDVYILFYRWDEGANRVNLAIVSRSRLDQNNVLYIPPLREIGLRPLIGVRINNRDYYSIHASSSGGGDAATLVSRVVENQLIINPLPWIIAGDYNQEPPTLQDRLGRQQVVAKICPPNGGTHPTNPSEPDRFPLQSKLDYAVWSKENFIEGWTDPRFGLTGGAPVSDHLPVFYKLKEF